MCGSPRYEQCFDYCRVALNLAAANALIWLRHCKCFSLAQPLRIFWLSSAAAANLICAAANSLYLAPPQLAKYVLKRDFTQILFKMDLTF